MKCEKGICRRYIAILKKIAQMSPLLISLRLIVVFLSLSSTYLLLIFPQYLLQALKTKNLKYFLLVVISMTILNFIFLGIIIFLNPKIIKLTESLNEKIISEFLEKSVLIQMSFFEKKDFYNKYTLIFEKCCILLQGTMDSFFQLLIALAKIVISITILSWMSPIFLICLLVFSTIQMLIGNRIKKINYKFQWKIVKNKKYLNYIYRLFHIPEFMKDIRINNLIDFLLSKEKDNYKEIIENTYKAQKEIAKNKGIQNVISTIESIIITVYLGYMVIIEKIWFDLFVVSQTSYTQMKSAVSNVLAIYNNIYENDLYIKDYLEFMNIENTIVSGNYEIDVESIEKIEFRSVSFSYPNSNTKVLCDVSFKINKGEKVLITGQNGSGKTTIIKLLLRLYSPSNGDILINEINICKYNIIMLRKAIGALLQDYAVYAFSIYDNICLGNEMPIKKINKIIAEMGLDSLINRAKEGVNTPITCQIKDNGIELSTGEQQRLAISRTLVKKAKFIILDEPTSNLDTITAQKIINSIIADNRKTVVLISHQLSMASKMSKIICMGLDTPIEIGTHSELIIKKGEYYRLYENYQKDGEV